MQLEDLFLSTLCQNYPGQTAKYPPTNIATIQEDGKVVGGFIEIAVAGFSKEDIHISKEPIPGTSKTKLVVYGNGTDGTPDDIVYSLRELAMRDFERTFVLDAFIEVKDITLIDGILTIKVDRVLPKEMKPVKLTIK